MSKALLYLSLAICISSCHVNVKVENSKQLSYYDSIQERNIYILDSMHLSRYNDSAKWRLYAIFCDDSCFVGRTNFGKIYFEKTPMCFLNLILTYVDKANDKLSLLYRIVYKDSIVVSKELANRNICDGVVYDVKSDTLIGYVAGEGMWLLDGLDTRSRYINPLQPDVVNFLKKYQIRLNPWLFQEAKKKGLIQ